MKTILMSILILTFISCASVSDLKEAKTCKVWEDQPVVGPFDVEANGSKSEWEGRCTILGIFVCEYVKSDIEGNKLYQDSNGIFNSRTLIAIVNQSTVKYEQGPLSKYVDVEPFKIEKEKKSVEVVTVANAFGKTLKSSKTIHFNNACSEQEVALGIVTLITAKNKR